MDAKDVFAELDRRYTAVLARRAVEEDSQPQIPAADADRWASAVGLTGADLCNLIAAHMAESFHDGRRSFEFCDAVVNDLFVYFFERGGDQRTDLYWAVYLAFDDGEYTRNYEDYDPVERHTRPQIAEIVDRLRVR
jgi:hypothetical protein